ncbi:MAG: RHS repeat-associated protein [Luteibaculaceae bacterium]|jgi:RHS repeat-associated protein
MEKDDEIKGTGNSLDFGARIYDPRVFRWLSVDPLAAKYPGMSPYNFAANNPIFYIDPDGNEIKPAPGLSAKDAERVKAVLKVVNEKMPKLYSYLHTLKYNPTLNNNQGGFVSRDDDGYNDDAAYNVNITVGIADIDGKNAKKERRDAFSGTSGSAIKLAGGSDADLSGSAELVEAGFSGVIKIGSNGEFSTYNKAGEVVNVNSVDELNNLNPAFSDVLKLNGKGLVHFSVNLDDYNGSSEVDAEITSHEFGHVEGFIKFQLNTAYFQTGEDKQKEGMRVVIYLVKMRTKDNKSSIRNKGIILYLFSCLVISFSAIGQDEIGSWYVGDRTIYSTVLSNLLSKITEQQLEGAFGKPIQRNEIG